MNRTLLTKDLQMGMIVKAILSGFDGQKNNEKTELGYVGFVDQKDDKFRLRIITDCYSDFHTKKDISNVMLHHNFNDCMIKENNDFDMNPRLVRIEFLPKKEYEKFLKAKTKQYEEEIELNERMIGERNAGIEKLAFTMPKMPRKKTKE